jgi:predicted transglutaminase-like cysteine proteinase
MAKRRSIVFTVLLALAALPMEVRAEGLLATTLFARSDISAFTKWTGMLTRFQKTGDACPPSRLISCPAHDWRAFIAGLRGQDRMAQITAVNARVNAAYYVGDQRNWGVPDYWATPLEFMARDGDCEDYAIAKYLTLRALGIDPAAMRIVVVDDLDLGRPHAVLTVERGDRTLVLDNLTGQVVDAAAVHHYRAIYSINETGWWLHHPPQRVTRPTAP